jgi:5-methylcytosine-specific restriction endonuclease McrA
MKVYFANYHAENAEKRNAESKQRALEHPEKNREKARRRRARKRGNSVEPYTEAQVLARYGTDCYLCGEPIDMDAPRSTQKKGWERGLHMEHVVAIDNGGSDAIGNVRPAHGLCNMKKGALVIQGIPVLVEGHATFV